MPPRSPYTPAQRTAAWRANLKVRGGRTVNVMLTPENAAWFDAQRAACPGMTATEFVNAVIAAEREACQDPATGAPVVPPPG